MDAQQILIDSDSLENLDLPVFIKNTDGVFVYCNQAFIDFLGIPKTNVIGCSAEDLIPKRIVELLIAADEELLILEKQKLEDSPQMSHEFRAEMVLNKSIIYTREHEIAGIIGTIDSKSSLKSGSPLKLKNLTPREIDVLRLLIQGVSAKGIAADLGITPNTVSHYLKDIYTKLGVHSKNQALFKALTLFKFKPL